MIDQMTGSILEIMGAILVPLLGWVAVRIAAYFKIQINSEQRKTLEANIERVVLAVEEWAANRNKGHGASKPIPAEKLNKAVEMTKKNPLAMKMDEGSIKDAIHAALARLDGTGATKKAIK